VKGPQSGQPREGTDGAGIASGRAGGDKRGLHQIFNRAGLELARRLLLDVLAMNRTSSKEGKVCASRHRNLQGASGQPHRAEL